jgi:hypothetical protein
MDRRRSGKLGSMYLAVRAIIHCNSFSDTRSFSMLVDSYGTESMLDCIY